MQRKYILFLECLGGTSQNRARTGAGGPRRTIQNGELKVITQNPKTGNLQLENATSTGRANTAAGGSRVPIWRKTHSQKVDDKVEGLFESYRLIDQAIVHSKDARSGAVA